MDVAAQNASLLCMFGDTRSTNAPATWTVVLFDDNPLTTGVGLATGGGYAPKAVANSTANWPAPSSGAIISELIDWGTSTDVWDGTAAYVGLEDESGNLWYSRPLAEPITVAAAGVVVPPIRVVVTMNAEDNA